MEIIKNRVARVFVMLGFSPDVLTWSGLLLCVLSGALISTGEFFWAGAVLLLSGLFDLMDGAVARLSGRVTQFGGILDSSLDRYGDGAIFAGIVVRAVTEHSVAAALLSCSAMIGSFAISYIRARSECVISRCKVGFWERGERLVYLALGLLLNNLVLVLWVIGVFTHVTAMHRLDHSRRDLLKRPHSPARPFWQAVLFHEGSRLSRLYYMKASALALLVLLCRIGGLE